MQSSGVNGTQYYQPLSMYFYIVTLQSYEPGQPAIIITIFSPSLPPRTATIQELQPPLNSLSRGSFFQSSLIAFQSGNDLLRLLPDEKLVWSCLLPPHNTIVSLTFNLLSSSFNSAKSCWSRLILNPSLIAFRALLKVIVIWRED
jgi:hypothetical protein